MRGEKNHSDGTIKHWLNLLMNTKKRLKIVANRSWKLERPFAVRIGCRLRSKNKSQ